MTVPDPDEITEKLLDEAERLAAMPESKQAAWLEQLRNAFASQPDGEKVLDRIAKHMKLCRAKVVADARALSIADQLEAQTLAYFEVVLKLREKAFPDRAAYSNFVSQVAVLGHQLPRVRDRLAMPDAQQFLSESLDELFP